MTVVGATPRNLDHYHNLDTWMWPPFRTDDAKHVFKKLFPRHTYLSEQNSNCGLPRQCGRRDRHPTPPARPCPRFLHISQPARAAALRLPPRPEVAEGRPLQPAVAAAQRRHLAKRRHLAAQSLTALGAAALAL